MKLVGFVKYIVLVCCAFLMMGTLGSAYALDIYCTRTSSDTTGFINYSGMEKWFPKKVRLDASIFSDKTNSTSMVAKLGSINITLLKNGNLMFQIDRKAGYRRTAVGKYKCDKNPNEIKLALGAQVSSPNASLSIDGVGSENNNANLASAYQNISDKKLCELAVKDGEWRQGEHIHLLIEEAKLRGLNCGVNISNSSDGDE